MLNFVLSHNIVHLVIHVLYKTKVIFISLSIQNKLVTWIVDH
jgi:hypothetical protein